jgi:hypothetical protein
VIEIKPCPFCGSVEIKVDKCTARVRCKNCFATGGQLRGQMTLEDYFGAFEEGGI